MTSLNLTLDLKLWFVTLIPEKKVHRITFLIVDSALLRRSSCLVGDPSSDTEVERLVVVDTYIHQACNSSRNISRGLCHGDQYQRTAEKAEIVSGGL
jgi:hypothetical protein